jgi:glucosamine-6-phosphate deaminase
MEEEDDKEQNDIELIDLDEEGNPIQKKEKEKPVSSNFFYHFLLIIIVIILLFIFLKIFVFNKNKIYLKFNNIEDLYRNVSEDIIYLVNKNPSAKIGIVYGEPLDGIYNYLINKYKSGEVSFKNVKFFSFDGLCGLKKDSNNSYFHFLNESFLSKIDAKEENLYLINEEGYNKCDFDDNLEVYNEIFEKISLDLQIILFDEDGNIGFNNLNTDFDAYAHIVKLTPKDRMKIKDLFGSLEKTPIYGVTLGIKNILQTKEIIAIGIGKDKAKVVRIITNGIFIKKYPITVLNKHSGKVTVYTDQEGGSLVKGFYKKF